MRNITVVDHTGGDKIRRILRGKPSFIVYLRARSYYMYRNALIIEAARDKTNRVIMNRVLTVLYDR